MKYLIIISINILFCSCTEKQEQVKPISKIDSLKSVAAAYITSHVVSKSMDYYINYMDEEFNRSIEHTGLHYSENYNYYTSKMEYVYIEKSPVIPELHVFYVPHYYVRFAGSRSLIAFDKDGFIYFLFGFKHSQFDVLLKRNIKHIETIGEANQIIDLYNRLNYILDYYEIKKVEKSNDSLAMSMLNQPKIDGDTIEIERLYYGDQISRYVKHTYRITKGLDFDVQQEDLMIKDRD